MRLLLRREAKASALAPALVAMLLCGTPDAPASAQVVYCTNCSSELTQLQNYLQLVSTLAKQAALLEQAITQTSLMVQNATPLSNPQYGSGQTDLQALQNLVAQTTALSYASANLDATVNARFQTYQTYTSSPLNSTGFAAKYQQWSQDMQASVLTTLKAAQTQPLKSMAPSSRPCRACRRSRPALRASFRRFKRETPLALRPSRKSRSCGSFCSPTCS